jgi:hypothetical protein
MKKRAPQDSITWNEFQLYENTYLLLDHATYRMLTQARFWIREVIIKEWIEYSVSLKKQTHFSGDIFDFYSLHQGYERDPYLINKYKALYKKLGLETCLYSGKDLHGLRYDLDHFFPWSKFPVSRFWNLFPADQEINQQKSDYLPVLDAVLSAIKTHLEGCLANPHESIIRNNLEYFYRVIQKEEFDHRYIDASEVVSHLEAYIKDTWMDLDAILPGKRFLYQE